MRDCCAFDWSGTTTAFVYIHGDAEYDMARQVQGSISNACYRKRNYKGTYIVWSRRCFTSRAALIPTQIVDLELLHKFMKMPSCSSEFSM